jgi:hypothetical protein
VLTAVLMWAGISATLVAVLWLVTGRIARSDWVPRAARAIVPPAIAAPPARAALPVSGPHKGIRAVVVAKVLPSGEETPGELAIRLGAGHPAIAAITGPPAEVSGG